jgi:hypothetical protein
MNSSSIRSVLRAGALTAIGGALAALAACTTTGIGSGKVEPGDAPVSFTWTSKDGGTTGTLSATVAKAPFSGPFVQMTSTTRVDETEGLWLGWQPGWNDWDYWGNYPITAFSTRYSGKVVANLAGPGSNRLRCRFHLDNPVEGMRGGGQGECQLTGGRTVDAVFPRS